jgi:beta-glucosidase
VRVTNSGGVLGSEVVQVYVSFPAEANEPPLVMRAFEKTPPIPPHESVEISFGLSRRDLSYWSIDEHGGGTEGGDGGRWRLAPGTFTVTVGASSRDIRLRFTVRVLAEGEE